VLNQETRREEEIMYYFVSVKFKLFLWYGKYIRRRYKSFQVVMNIEYNFEEDFVSYIPLAHLLWLEVVTPLTFLYMSLNYFPTSNINKC